MKEVVIKFDEKAFKEYEKLQDDVLEGKKAKKKPTYEQLLDSVNNALKNIKIDYKYGDLIPRKYISKSTVKKYGTDRIFRVELVGYWRLLYTIIGNEIEIIALILEYMSHEEYNKVFGYKKK
jgi:aromatic ring-opening dioxygenase LigB subunit